MWNFASLLILGAAVLSSIASCISTVSLDSKNYGVTRGESQLAVGLQISPPLASKESASVMISTFRTAQSSNDMEMVNQTIRMGAGESSIEFLISFPTVGEDIEIGSELFAIALIEPRGQIILGENQIALVTVQEKNVPSNEYDGWFGISKNKRDDILILCGIIVSGLIILSGSFLIFRSNLWALLSRISANKAELKPITAEPSTSRSISSSKSRSATSNSNSAGTSLKPAKLRVVSPSPVINYPKLPPALTDSQFGHLDDDDEDLTMPQRPRGGSSSPNRHHRRQDSSDNSNPMKFNTRIAPKSSMTAQQFAKPRQSFSFMKSQGKSVTFLEESKP